MPNGPPNSEEDFEFLHDTGASVMTIFRDDLELLVNRAGNRRARYIRSDSYNTSGGPVVLASCEIEVALRDQNDNELTRWMAIEVAVVGRRRRIGEDRLSGPWLHFSVFTATAPDNDRTLRIARIKSDLTTSDFPTVQLENTSVPNFVHANTAGVPNPPPANWTHAMFSGVMANATAFGGGAFGGGAGP